MTDAPTNLSTQIAELRRELDQRAKVYPRLIANHKLKKSAADYCNANIEGAISNLHWLRENRALIAAFKAAQGGSA